MEEATETLSAVHPPRGPTSFRLLVVIGPDLGRELIVDKGPFIVGTTADCDLVLSDRRVSRHHLELASTGEGLRVRDLRSKNGSYLENARFTEIEVGIGGVVKIGDSALKVLALAHRPHLMPSSSTRFGRLVGQSLPMRELFALLERVAPTHATVLIEGETGTGKELCAEAIHAASPRAARPFVVCDLAGVSRALIESELFGHRRGAFTGAETDRNGLFVDAAGGTVLIDEIGELDRELQPRLLRMLEHHEIRPLGGSYRSLDVRVLAATHRDLERDCKEGRFRADLFHRLAVVRVRMPPLRERKEDIPLLVAELLVGRDVILPPETMALLTEHDWPGNVRELRNVVERGCSLVRGDKVLAPSLLGLDVASTDGPASERFHAAKEKLLASWERAYLTDLLRRSRGNVARAARASGLGRSYLHRLLRKHGMDRR